MSGPHRDDLTPTESFEPGSTTGSTGGPVDPTPTRQTALPGHEADVVLHEEQAEVGTELHESGRVKVRKHVETFPVEQTVSRDVEHADTSERAPATDEDTGEVLTLPDGSISIPVFEEVLVVTKKLVVRERVVVRKHTVVDEHVLRTDLRREHVSVDAEGDAVVEDRTGGLPGESAAPQG